MAKKKLTSRKAAPAVATASKTARPSKAEAVREHLRANPSASNDEVVSALKKQGITITSNYVSVVKSQARERERRKQASETGSSGQLAAEAGLGLQQIKMAANLIRVCGGVKEARMAIDAAEDVARALEGGR